MHCFDARLSALCLHRLYMYIATILDETFLSTIFDFTKDMTILRHLNDIEIYCL